MGGTLSGLSAGGNLTLADNGTDSLALSTNGAFVFKTTVPTGGAYATSIVTQPVGQVCTVSNGSGTITSNVSNVAISCAALTYTVGGTVSGLSAGQQLTVTNNGGDSLVVNSNGNFAFVTSVAYGGSYAVAVSSQPAALNCTVANSAGSAIKANVTNVAVSCIARTLTVGGTVSGLPNARAFVSLKMNGAGALKVTANGAFSFAAPIAYGGSYAVTIDASNTNVYCSITHGSGPSATGNVSDVAVSCSANVWVATGSMAISRYNHTATLLPNGKVLVTGGTTWNGTAYATTASAELFDPATGTWTATGSMSIARGGHMATLLADGTVLVEGGATNAIALIAEIYHPDSGTWTTTASMSAPHSYGTATLLSSGKVLVAGGIGYTNGDVNVVEIYDPVAATWAAAGQTSSSYSHAATLMPNGKVLTTGGFSAYQRAEIYDPSLNASTFTSSMATPRYSHSSALLPSGSVLVAGGFDRSVGNSTASAEIYDPVGGLWHVTGSMTSARVEHATTSLPDGTLLVSGGFSSAMPMQNGAETYNPTTGTWTAVANMNDARSKHAAQLLSNGTVLVMGGANQVSSAEIYYPIP